LNHVATILSELTRGYECRQTSFSRKSQERYSEDLDFVQKTAEPIDNLLDYLHEVLNHWLVSQNGNKYKE